jgi:hypothetical protein
LFPKTPRKGCPPKFISRILHSSARTEAKK